MIIITETLINMLVGASLTAILKYLCDPSLTVRNYMILSVAITTITYILYLLQKINEK